MRLILLSGMSDCIKGNRVSINVSFSLFPCSTSTVEAYCDLITFVHGWTTESQEDLISDKGLKTRTKDFKLSMNQNFITKIIHIYEQQNKDAVFHSTLMIVYFIYLSAYSLPMEQDRLILASE